MIRPNVLILLTDQQRADTLGHRKQTLCKTPHIDDIAAKGVSFDRAITPCPLCLPSRASLFTGKYPTEIDMMSNSTGNLTSCELLDAFREANYQINYAGKWHLGENNIPNFTDRHAGDSTAEYSEWCLAQGLIDGWMFNDPATRTTRTPSMSTPKVHRQHLPVDKTNDAYVTDLAIDMIRTRDPHRPFFQVVSYSGPHPPFMIPEPYFSMYDPKDVQMPANFGPQTGEHPSSASSYYRQLFLDHGKDFDAWRASYAVYWGFVSMIDHMVGHVMSALEDEGLGEDTIVVFMSDHGENLGAHGLWHKMVPYEESIRIPLILSVPGGDTGSRSLAPASLVDVAPTLAALCDVPFKGPGDNLLNRDSNDEGQPAVFAMHQPLGDWMGVTDWRMIEEDRFKYIWHRGSSDELFNLRDDPYELRNLIDTPKAGKRLKHLKAELGAFLQTTSDPMLHEWQNDQHKATGPIPPTTPM